MKQKKREKKIGDGMRAKKKINWTLNIVVEVPDFNSISFGTTLFK